MLSALNEDCERAGAISAQLIPKQVSISEGNSGPSMLNSCSWSLKYIPGRSLDQVTLQVSWESGNTCLDRRMVAVV